MSGSLDDERWRRFFELYRDLPEIWNVKCEAYKIHRKRNRAWEMLLEAYQTIDKNATMDRLKHRVSNIRTCYRRELNKIRQSQKFGSSADDVHVPTLWYFNMLDFLKDQENSQTRRFRGQIFKGDTEEQNTIMPNEQDNDEPRRKQYKIKNKKLMEKEGIERQNNKLTLDNMKDDAAIYAESWACSYRKLSMEQQLFAKKAIEEILILGQLNVLTLDVIDTSVKTTAKPEFAEIFDPNNPAYDNNDMQCCIEKI